MPSTTLTIDQLRLSPFNVRTNEEDASATDALEASLLAEGQLHALQVHPMRGRKDRWCVYAGGRRYRSFSNLVKRGDLPADHPIKVEIHDSMTDAQLIVGSLAENVIRRNLRDYETYAAVKRARAMGDTIEAIAVALGQPAALIEQWSRIGQLAKPIFDAFASGRISRDAAQAYAATDDEQLQMAAFEALNPLSEWHRRPEDIRKFMRFDDRVAEREMRYVGEDTYLAAGGRLQLDIFADPAEPRRLIVDPPILRRLLEEKLGTLREDLRARTRPDLRFVPRAPRREEFDTPDYSLQVHPIEQGGAITLPPGEIVAHITVNEDGRPVVTWWYANAKAKYDTVRETRPRPAAPPRATTGAAIAMPRDHEATRDANAAIKEEEGVSQETVEIFRSMRRAILRAALVDDAIANKSPLGRDFFIWSQLRVLIDTGAHSTVIGVTPLHRLDAGPEGGREHVARMPATASWARALARIQARPFLTDPDYPRAFAAYIGEPEELKDLAGAVMAGMSLARSLNAEGYDLPVHNALAGLLDLRSDQRVREYWAPTAELLDRIPTRQRLAIAKPFVESVTFGPWARLKGADITRNVLAVVTGTAAGMRAILRDAATTWVHPLLRFGPDDPEDPEANDAQPQLQEAAE